FCWFINGTICENATCKNWEKKILVCKNCVVMKSIK
ncbi:MAG TPA: transcriptional regulator, partial [Desulfobulbaceae bacterium]|nr:transcriptional regulator [Desulfobulbaceae bacterium]